VARSRGNLMNKLANVCFTAASLVICGFAAPVSASPLTVLDASFESLPPGAYSPPASNFVAPWLFGCGLGTCGEAGILALSTAPDGAQVGYTSSAGVAGHLGSIAQDVAAIIPGATYTFSILVGQSTTEASLTGYRLVLGYDVTPNDPSTNVQFANVLFTAPGDIPAEGDFLLATITAVAPNNATGDVTIAFGSGSFAMWDEASLAVATTPLPAALPLFAGGLGLIGLLARRRKQKLAAQLH